jgi:transposase-like protein
MVRKTSEAWGKRVERWRRSGLTAAQFAAREGVNPHTLAYWKWKLRQGEELPRGSEREAIGAGRAADFVELVAPRREVAEPAPTFEVVLARGYRVRIADGFAGDALTRLLDVLEARR